jgi:hypothetical protein
LRILTYHFHTIKKQQFRFSWSKNSNQFIEEIIFSKLQKSNILIKLNFYCESSFAAWRVLWPSQSIRFVLQYFRTKYKNEKESKSMQSKNMFWSAIFAPCFLPPLYWQINYVKKEGWKYSSLCLLFSQRIKYTFLAVIKRQ